MKKAFLSIVLTLGLMAGGDISPVAPVAPASADFWGQIGFSYQVQDDDTYKWSDKENNAFSSSLVVGFDKELGYGFGIGGEIAGWTDFGFDIADAPRTFSDNPLVAGSTDQTAAEISQAYITYTFGNTTIKAGRQALPKAVSPWAWSDRTAGVIDMSYDGITLVNTDLEGNTLVGGWIKQVYLNSQFEGDFDKGLFMGTVINKSIPDTVISGSFYYVPDNELAIQHLIGGQDPKDTWSIWGTAESVVYDVNLGIQGVYVDGDYKAKETYGIALKVGKTFGDFDAEAIVGYINDGDYSLVGAGSGIGTSAFWTDYEVVGDTVGEDQYAILGKVGYRLPVGKVYGGLGYWDFDNVVRKNSWGGRLGYEFEIAGIDAKIEYRYLDESFVNSSLDNTRQRVRVEAFYKF